MDIKNGANSLLKLLKKDKFRNVILFLGIGGIALIYISTWIDFSPKEPEAEQETVSYSAAEYERQLETGLRQVVAAITGEENPTVLVTLESTGKTVYAQDEKKSSREGEEQNETIHILLKDSEGAQHALTVTEIQPKVKGVVVVSEFAGDSVIREKLIYAMKTALDISSTKVCVIDSGK